MTEKVVGYSLLVVGILVIVFSALSVYLVFTKAVQPVQLFNFPGISLDLGSLVPGVTSTALKSELISGAMLNDTANIMAHLFLMGFIASIGYKLASLGILLVRPITVKLLDKV